jgi:starvation-inducible DNA-binding protein
VSRGTILATQAGMARTAEKTAPDIDIGIDADDRRAVAEGLSHLLADTFTLYLKTHSFHWNVTGKMFRTLHTMFEEQYQELWKALDVIAERIRALGHPAPGSQTQFASMSSVKEETGVPTADDMIRQLVDGHETAVRTARSVFASAEGAGDQATQDLIVERMQVHEKTAWMLRSLLE